MLRRWIPFALIPLFLAPTAGAHAASGWYFSGKGGPSFSSLNSLKASDSSNTLSKSSSANVVGAFGMAGGYQWMYKYHIPLRTEIEFMNRTEVNYNVSPLMKGTAGGLASTAQNITTMANFYWHFPVDSYKWWPYVSAGIGWAHTTIKSEYTSSTGTATKTQTTVDNPAWSLGAGVTLKVGPHMMNDIELRYVDSGKLDWGMPSSRNLKSSGFAGFSSTEVIFALRYMF